MPTHGYILAIVGLEAHLEGRSARLAPSAPLERPARPEPRPAREPAAQASTWKEASEVKTRFLNMAAHELNTPLTPLRLQVHMLQSGACGKLTGRAAKAVKVVARNLERLHELVQEILDVARMEGGGLRTTLNVFGVDEAVAEAVEAYEATAKTLGVQLSGPKGKGGLVEADRKRVLQILHNLVSNAIKFTGRGGRVEVAVKSQGGADGTIAVAVRDTGAGLTAEQLGALFQPFSRPLERQLPDAGGSGLGLFISRGLAEAMGGALTASSPGPGKGATFTLTLPKAGAKQLVAPKSPADDDPIARRLREMM